MAVQEELLSMAQSLNSEVSKLQASIQENKVPEAGIVPQLTRISSRMSQLGHEAQGTVAPVAEKKPSHHPSAHPKK